MASASDLLNILNNHEESLSNRLNIANRVFLASDLKLRNKEVVILTWAIRNCTSETASDNVWSLIKAWLSSEQFENINRAGISDDEIENLLKALCSKITTEDTLEMKESAADCLVMISQNRIFHQFFKCNVEFYCTFIGQIISTLTDRKVFLALVSNEHIFSKAISSQEQFSKYFLKHILENLMYKLELYLDDDVFEALSSLISQGVYSKNLKVFDSFFKNIFGEDAQVEKENVPKQLFKYLVAAYETETSYKITFKLLFHSFCHSCRKSDLIYKCFILLFEMVGFDSSCHFAMNKISKYKVQSTSLEKSIGVVSDLVAVLTGYTSITSCNICDISFINFMSGISTSLIHLTKSPDENCYKLLIDIIQINPLVIEEIVESVLPYIMLSDNKALLADYEKLMISIFATYAKLHRVQSLISKMITSIKNALYIETEEKVLYPFKGIVDMDKRDFKHGSDIFTDNILNHFSQCIMNQASWQIINLLKTLIFHLNTAVNELCDMKQGSRKLIYIELVSILTDSLLSSVRIAEHTIPQNVIDKFVKGMNELREVLANFGKAILKKEHNQILMKSFLHICYAWAEVHMMLTYYSEENFTPKGLYDSNISACNITYLHSYLSVGDWCLISERISNFGEKPCKLIMQKLFSQKLRAMLIFEDGIKKELKSSVAKAYVLNLDESWELIVSDKFNVHNLTDYFTTHELVCLAEHCLQDIVSENKLGVLSHLYVLENQYLRNALIYVLISAINQLMKHKRKLDDNFIWKPLQTKIFSSVSVDHFISNNELLSEELVQIKQIFHDEICKESDASINATLNVDAILKYLDIFEKLPVIFCSNILQTVITCYIVSLHKDFHQLKQVALKKKIENLIIGIVQQNKMDLASVFTSSLFIEYLAKNFENVETIFSIYLEHVIKSEDTIMEFETGVQLLCDNVKKSEFLPLCIHLLKAFPKWKKYKQTPLMKTKIQEYSIIQKKLLKIITKQNLHPSSLEIYALLLKMELSKAEGDGALAELKSLSDVYLQYAISNDEHCIGDVLLLTTVLRHKSDMNLDDAIYLRVWNAFNIEKLPSGLLNEYSPLIQLIFEHVPNDNFMEVTVALSNVTRTIIENEDMTRLSVLMKIWMSILSSNFNTVKLKIWQETLENYMFDLLALIESSKCNADISSDIVLFINNIIQTVQIPLTPSMCDILLMFPKGLLFNKKDDSISHFSSVIMLMNSLLRYRKILMMDRLPTFLQGYKMLLKVLCEHGNSDLKDPIDKMHSMSDCAHGFEKLTNNIVSCKKDMARISCFLIADILNKYEEVTLYPDMKKHLNNCIYSLISLCDQHAVAYLMRVLSSASTEMFKIMYEHYKKFYKFTGKV